MVMMFFSSCSVKERRDICYTSLKFDIDTSACKTDRFYMEIHDGSYTDFAGFLQVDSALAGLYDFTLIKGYKQFYGFFGGHNTVYDSPVINTAEGKQTDSLYLFSEQFLCDSDSATLFVRPQKEFIKITVNFTDNYLGVLPFHLRVKGDITGINIYTADPVRGQFVHRVKRAYDGSMSYPFRVPRQTKETAKKMNIELWHEDDEVLGYGEHLYTFNLYELMESIGYDWSAPEPQDCSFTIDYVEMTDSFYVNGWMVGWKGEITM